MVGESPQESKINRKESFRKISTQWGVMEEILEEDGIQTLAEYLTIRYYQPLTKWAKKFQPQMDEISIYEVVSDVFMELLKNNYQKLRELDRNRDHFRGLLTTILKRKLSKWYKEKQKNQNLSEENISTQLVPQYLDFVIDLGNCLERMQEERFLAYKAFNSFHIEGKSLKETAEELDINENAVSQRLHSARKWLRGHLKEY